MKLPVMELFGPTIQGEGILAGTISHFLRLGGCGLRCTWCDSMYAVLPKEVKKYAHRQTIAEIIENYQKLPWAPYLTLTGGDPCIHKHINQIFPFINGQGTRIAIETQGELFPDWLGETDIITFSPKGPSSGNEVDPTEMISWIHNAFRRYKGRICLKIVCFDQADIDYAMSIYKFLPENLYQAFYFTAGTPPFDPTMTRYGRRQEVVYNFAVLGDAMLTLVRKAQEFNDKVHIGCQQHVLLWPNQERGV